MAVANQDAPMADPNPAMEFPSLAGTPVPLGEKVRQMVLAGDSESARGDFAAALDCYRGVLALGGADGAESASRVLDDAAQASVMMRVAHALVRLGRTGEALETVERAAGIARALPAGREHDAVRLAVELQWTEVYIELGDYRRAAEHARAAGSLLATAGALGDPEGAGLPAAWSAQAGRLHNHLGHIAARNGDNGEAEREFNRAAAFCRRAGDLMGLAQSFNNLGLVAKNRCQWSKARELLTVSQRLRAESDEARPYGAFDLNLGILQQKLGEWAEAARSFERSLACSEARGDVHNQVRVALAIGNLYRLRREYARAEETLGRAVAMAESHRYLRELSIGLRLTAELAFARHQLNETQDNLERAEAVALRIAPEGDLMTEIARVRAELALALGNAQGAVEAARAAKARAHRLDDAYEEALAEAALARALDLAGDPTGARAAHIHATTWLRELGARHPLARSLVAFAAHLRRHGGDRGPARQALREAISRFEECGDPLGPALARLEGARGELAAGSLDAAVELLADAARDLRRADPDSRERIALREVEGELEEAMVNSSLAARRVASHAREETAGAQRPEKLREHLTAVVSGLARSCAADGALLAHRRGPGAPLELLARTGLDERAARELLRSAPPAFEESMAGGVPLVSLDAARDRDDAGEPGERAAGEAGRQVASYLLIPLRPSGEGQGFLYVERLRAGAASPLGQKDLNLALTVVEELTALVTEMDLREKSEEGIGMRDRLRDRIAFADVVTQNREMFEMLRLVGKVSATPMTVLIQGETGTGKQLIAQAIHASSERRDRAFVTIDCAALPDNLLESELFGYRRGAFTGATQDRKGLAEEADGGTIFLDEICKAGLSVQQRLLHLLDCGEIRSVGSTTYRRLDVRVISATSVTDLRKEVEEGRFLKDLYYRLNDFAVTVPALRERREDILLLSEHFLAQFARECRRPVPEISRAALRVLLEYDWPGNVRELQKVMRRAAVLADDDEPLGVEHLPGDLCRRERAEAREDDLSGSLKDAVEMFERRLILATLERCHWNKSRAAEELGLSRKGLRNKIERMELVRSGARAPSPAPRAAAGSNARRDGGAVI